MKIKTIITTILILIVHVNYIYAQNANAKIMSPEQYMTLAKEYAKQDEPEKLNELMADMLEKYPDNPYALRHKGAVLMLDGDLDESERIINYAIEKNPNFVELDELYLTLGDIFNFKQNFKQAEDYFKKAIEITPDSRAHANLFLVFVRQEKYKEAIQEFKLFLDNRKPNDYLFLRLGDAYYALGEYKPAVIAYQKSIDYGGAMYDFNELLGLAKSYEALGDYYHAEIAYNELMKHHKFDRDAREAYNKFKKKLEEQKK